MNYTNSRADLDFVPFWFNFLQIAFIVLVMLVGTIGNLLTIIVVFKLKNVQTKPTVFVTNLAVADLLVCSLMSGYYVTTVAMGMDPPGGAIFGFMVMMSMIVSMLSLTLIAINRYVLILKRSDVYHKIFSKRNIKISLVGTWVTAAMVLMPISFGFGKLGFNVKFGTCMMVAYDLSTYLSVVVILHLLIAPPALIIPAVCYGKIICFLYRSAERHNKNILKNNNSASKGECKEISENNVLMGSETISVPTQSTPKDVYKDLVQNENKEESRVDLQISITDSEEEVWVLRAGFASLSPCKENETNGKEQRTSLNNFSEKDKKEITSKIHQGFKLETKTKFHCISASKKFKRKKSDKNIYNDRLNKRNRKVTMNLFIVWVTFIVCWFPLMLFYTVDIHGQVPGVIYHIFCLLAYSNSAMNPFIYAFMNRDFRKGLKRLLP